MSTEMIVKVEDNVVEEFYQQLWGGKLNLENLGEEDKLREKCTSYVKKIKQVLQDTHREHIPLLYILKVLVAPSNSKRSLADQELYNEFSELYGKNYHYM